MHTVSHWFLYTGHEYWKKPKKVNLFLEMFFLHQMLHLKMYVQKMLPVQPCQVENHHTTGIKTKSFVYCLILVRCSPVHTKSSVQTWDTQQSPQTPLAQPCGSTLKAGLFHCSWSELAPSLGTRYLHWSHHSDPFKRPFTFYSLWKKLCYKHGLGLALFSQTQNLLHPFLKAPARNRSMQPLPGHP